MQKQISFQIDEEKIKKLRKLTLKKHGLLHGTLKTELIAAVTNHISKLEEEMKDVRDAEVGE